MTDRACGDVLVVERIEVGERRLTAVVRVTREDAMRTREAEGLPAAALGLLPGLRRHTCDNDHGLGFEHELRDTETPHLLEHVTCELMALAGSPRSLRGETRWDFALDGRGVFRVTIEFDDEQLAREALVEARRIAEWLLDTAAHDTPDVTAIVAQLMAARAG